MVSQRLSTQPAIHRSARGTDVAAVYGVPIINKKHWKNFWFLRCQIITPAHLAHHLGLILMRYGDISVLILRTNCLLSWILIVLSNVKINPLLCLIGIAVHSIVADAITIEGFLLIHKSLIYMYQKVHNLDGNLMSAKTFSVLHSFFLSIFLFTLAVHWNQLNDREQLILHSWVLDTLEILQRGDVTFIQRF